MRYSSGKPHTSSGPGSGPSLSHCQPSSVQYYANPSVRKSQPPTTVEVVAIDFIGACQGRAQGITDCRAAPVKFFSWGRQPRVATEDCGPSQPLDWYDAIPLGLGIAKVMDGAIG